MRILAIYHERDGGTEARWLQIDVSREPGYWALTRLLASHQVEEIRLVGETEGSVAVARTLAVAGRYRPRWADRKRRLRARGDEGYPRRDPFIYIAPRPDPSLFD